jgi:hypothetical protein
MAMAVSSDTLEQRNAAEYPTILLANKERKWLKLCKDSGRSKLQSKVRWSKLEKAQADLEYA